jgi:AcrR family transcriptional regulator
VARLSRPELKERTRTELLAAARAVFLRRGFHDATLDEIAEEAGYSKGAVYSNFAAKDELLLAVLDEHYEGRIASYRSFLSEPDTLENHIRAVARFMVESDAREPEWSPLLLQFWAHSFRREALRTELGERRERFLDVIAELIADLNARHGIEFTLPAKEVARASGALARGMAVERLVNPDSISVELFEEMHLALMTGFIKPSNQETPRTKGRNDGARNDRDGAAAPRSAAGSDR